MFGTLHPDEVEDILFTHHVGHLACIADNAPYVVPVSCVYTGGSLYGVTMPGRKVDALRKNSAVSFGVVDIANPRRWHSVLVEGLWAEVDDLREREQALVLLEQVGTSVDPHDPGIVFRITPKTRSGRWIQNTTRSGSMAH